MATTAQFVSTPIIDISQIATGNTLRDGNGTFGLVCPGPTFAAGAGVGKRITRGVIHATQATSNGAVRFFANDQSGNKRLILEKSIPAITPSATVSAYRTEVQELVGMVLPGVPAGGTWTSLWASTELGNTFNIMFESGNL